MTMVIRWQTPMRSSVYLAQTYAKGSHWMPEEPKTAAQVQRWLTVAADNIYSGPCAARLVKLFGAPLDHEGRCCQGS